METDSLAVVFLFINQLFLFLRLWIETDSPVDIAVRILTKSIIVARQDCI